MENLSVKIAAGRLHLQLARQDIPLWDALDFATRRNPKRPFLFVSKLLGRHIPTRPKVLRETAGMLSRGINSVSIEEPVLFFGMAETATALGQAVFHAWIQEDKEGLYVDTTRRTTGGEIAFTFREDHSHAVEHFVHLPSTADDPSGIFRRARTVVIVDDETTTGKTAIQLLGAYEKFAGRQIKGCLAVIASWLSGSSLMDDIEIVSLVEGLTTFDGEATSRSEQLPALPANGDAGSRSPAPRGSRHGLRYPQRLAQQPACSGQKVLVVGVGEFLYLPLLFAEAIEAQGAQAWLMATTRSPIQHGGAIQHVREFSALTGEGYREYLYNLPSDHQYDRVVICGENPLDIPEAHPLRDIPHLEQYLLEAQDR
jgi:hypothetical protein